MSKRVFALFFSLVTVAVVYAVPPTYLLTTGSLLSQTSFGLFTNSFDAAFNESDAGTLPTFSTLTQSYLFTGLANDFSGNVGTVPLTPFTFGYYGPGPKAWSLLGDVVLQTANSTLSDGTVVTSAAKTVGASSMSWATQSAQSTYQFLDAWNAAGNEQFLMKLGSLNLGALLNWYYTQNTSGAGANAFAAANVNQTTTFNYDTSGLGVAPAPALNYTESVSLSKPDGTLDIGLTVPLYFKVGSIGFDVAPKVEYNRYDASITDTISYTPPQRALAGNFPIATGALNTTTDVTGFVTTALSSTASLPSLAAGNANNLFEVNLDGYLTFYTADPLHVVKNGAEQWNYAGGGAGFTYPVGLVAPGAVNQTDTTTTRGAGIAYRVAPSAQQKMYFDLGEGSSWAIGPKVDLELNYAPISDVYRTQITQIASTDGDGNGKFTDAADQIVTTVTTYNHNNEGGTWNVIGGIELPVALTFRPSAGFFGVTVGANPRLLYTLTVVSSTPETFSQTISATDGTGAAIAAPGGITSVTAGTADPVTRTNSAWTFDSGFELSFDFYLPADTTLHIMWSGAGNLSFQGTLSLK